jgi:WD40 repeat protein
VPQVFRLEDQLPLYTLHGHCGPVTCLFIDRISPMMSGSGSQDGLLCVWDLLTGETAGFRGRNFEVREKC